MISFCCDVQFHMEKKMKAKFFAAALCCLIAALPVQAAKSSHSNHSSGIDLNTADVNALTKSIKGIGDRRAKAIIKYREAHGKFKSINELASVPGLGKKFVDGNINKLQETFSVK